MKFIESFVCGVLFTAIAFIFSGFNVCKAAEWDTTDKALFAGLVTLQVVDALQTNEIRKHQDQFRETNPLYGNPPNMAQVVAVKTLVTGAVYYVAKDSPNRKLILGIADALMLSVVVNNYSVGVRINF